MADTRPIFTGIAAGYDRMNRLLSLGLDPRWRRTAVSLIEGNPVRALDIACGTGDLTRALATRFPEAEVVGADFTPAMLEIAVRKCADLPRVRFVEGDAHAMDFADGSFECASCAFGFRNFDDAGRVLRECARVLRSGGELVVLEFFRPGSRLLGFLTALWLRIVAPILAPRRRDAYAYLRDSMGRTMSADEFIGLARAAGFRLSFRRFFLPACTCLVFKRG